MRRALTIYYFSEIYNYSNTNNVILALSKENILPEDFEKNKIALQGELPIWSKGANLLYYSNMCPEINLFDTEHSIACAKGIASSSGEWDSYRTDCKFKNISCTHFTECPEYNFFIEKLSNKKPISNKKRRPPISPTLRFEILQRDNFTCQYCGRGKEDGAKLVLDHKIPYSDGGKDDYNNLITSCNECNMGKSNKII